MSASRSASSNGNGQGQQWQRLANRRQIPPRHNIACIYGVHRSECGYCKGDRLNVLRLPNPPSAQLLLADMNSSDNNVGVSSDRNATATNAQTNGSAHSVDSNGHTSSQEETTREDVVIIPETKSEVDKATTSKAYMLYFHKLHAQDYQYLIDRGWRRSGKNLYLPKNWESCCPLLPIRLQVSKYVKSKSQKKVEKRFYKFLKYNAPSNETSEKMKYVHVSKKINSKKQDEASLDRDIILKSKILIVLQEMTKNAWMKTMNENEYKSEQVTLLLQNLNDEKQKSLCDFKIVKTKNKTRRITKDPNTDEVQSTHVVVSNTKLCPSLHGMSKGNIDKVELGQKIVNILSNDIDSWAKQIITSCDDENNTHLLLLNVKPNVTLHDKSGHIQVNLDIHFQQNAQNLGKDETMDTTMTKAASKDSSTVNMEDAMQLNNNDPDSKVARNIFGEFIESSKRMNMEFKGQKQTNGKTGSNGHSQSRTNSPSLPSPPYTITVRSVPVHISILQPEVHRLYAKYQTAIHSDPNPYSEEEESKDNNKESNDEIDDEVEGSLTFEDFERIYPQYSYQRLENIYKSYLRFVHFLSESPFEGSDGSGKKTSDNVQSTDNGDFQVDADGYDTHVPFGCYHQQYRINDEYLFAVGVVDILPDCLSAVYSFFDPDLSKALNLGKFTALREIEWVKRASIHRPRLKYYYLGFYVHSCQKMRYKAEYKPSEILCPDNQVWVDFEIAEKRLQSRSPVRHCCNLSTPGVDEVETEKRKRGRPVEVDSRVNDTRRNLRQITNEICLDIEPSYPLVKIQDLEDHTQNYLLSPISEFINEVGPDLSQRCILQWYN